MIGIGNDCLSPIYLPLSHVDPKYRDKTKYLRMRCGHCLNCKVARTKEWSLRLAMEATQYQPGEISFVTLTFSESNVWSINQETGELVKTLWVKDVQNYMKRVRTNLKRTFGFTGKVRYYACGEYGPKTHRPHYHLLVFGIPTIFQSVLDDSWSYGFTCIKPFFPETCIYVAGYIQKKLYGEVGSFVYEDIEPPFSCCSHHLGEDWFFKPSNYDNIVHNGFVMFQGYKHAIPKAFRRKMVALGDLTKMDAYDLYLQQKDEVVKLGDACRAQGISLSHYFKCFRESSVARHLRNNVKRNKEFEQ